MNNRRFTWLWLWLLSMLAPLPAQAVTPLVADLSNYRIDIDAGFNGTRLFLFGARNDNGDVIVVVRGPRKNFILRKKEEIAGLWVNSDRMKFYSVPDFYALASSRPLTEIMQSGVFRQLGIGQDTLLTMPPDPKSRSNFDEFEEAFLRYQHERRLYNTQAEKINFMGETLFKTTIEFPDNIPPGNYTAEIYLFSDGEVVGMQSTPITVVKSGLDAFLHMYAHQYPALYGIAAVFMAVFAGWFAGRIFEKI
jgi:uncharacterized protein (TIGR02186 family)